MKLTKSEIKQKTAYEMNLCDWSSDVCSSDLGRPSRRNLSGIASALHN